MRISHHIISFIFILCLIFSFSQSVSAIEDSACRQYLDSPIVSIDSSSTFSNYKPENAIDSDINTHWFGNPEEQFPKWIYADLGNARCVNQVSLTFFVRDVPISFYVETSLNGESWETARNLTIASVGGEVNSINFDTTLARYIKITIENSVRPHGTLSELEIVSAALKSSDGNSLTIALTENELPSTISLFRSNGELLEKHSISNQQITFSDLANEQHLLEVACPSSSAIQPLAVIASFFSSLFIAPFESLKSRSALFSPPVQPYGGDIPRLIPDLSSTTPTLINPEGTCGSYEFRFPVSADSSSTFSNYKPENAIDSDINTHWFGNPEEQFPKWIYADLGKTSCLNSLEVFVPEFDTPQRMEVHYSLNGNEWFLLNNSYTVSSRSERLEFSSITARFVALKIISSKRDYGAISEIKLSSAPYDKNLIPSNESEPEQEQSEEQSFNAPSLFVIVKDDNGNPLKVKVKAQASNQEQVQQTTSDKGITSFTNMISKDTDISLTCPR